MNQKAIKALKRDIEESSAIQVGYYAGLSAAILSQDEELLFDLLQDQAAVSWLQEAANRGQRGEFYNILVTEAVKKMSYSDFREIAHYFFSYHQTEAEILAEEILISRGLFQRLQREGEELFQIKHPPIRMETVREELTHELQPTGDKVIAIDPVSQQFALLLAESFVEPYNDPQLLTSYQSSLSPFNQVAKALIDEASPTLFAFLTDNPKSEEADDSYEKNNVVRAVSERLKNESDESRFNSSFIEAVNHFLQLENKELILHEVIGYSPGDRWTLAYLWDKNAKDALRSREAVEIYLEHEIGAYYRGSLTELRLVNAKKESLDSFLIDREWLWREEVSRVKELTENPNFTLPEIALQLEKLEKPLSVDELAKLTQEPLDRQQEIVDQLKRSIPLDKSRKREKCKSVKVEK